LSSEVRLDVSMHPASFGLARDAFGLSPDPGLIYMSLTHAKALAALRLGVENHRGLIVMTGEVGTGKTLLLHVLLRDVDAKFRTAYISNTKLSFDDLLRQALDDFGAPCGERDRLALLNAFNAFLRDSASSGSAVVLVIDEAQNLSDDALENVRLLSNYETYGGKLLQIILAGQPELGTRLRASHLRQLNERVAVRCHLEPLQPLEVERYIEHRLALAGGYLDLFTPGALRLIIREARGIPRRVNLLCYGAMIAARQKIVDDINKHRVDDGDHAGRVDADAVRAAIRERRGPAIGGAELRHWTGGRWARPFAERLVARAAFAVLVGFSALAGVFVALRTSGTPAANEPGTAAVHGSHPAHGPDAGGPPPARAAAPVTGVPGTDKPTDSGVANAVRAVEPGPLAANEPADKVRVEPASQAAYDLVQVPAGSTLGELARSAYGSAAPEVLGRIQQANPRIVDLNRIHAGDVLRFPK
jgi:type II secretory pathway predicted ATPase ExeA